MRKQYTAKELYFTITTDDVPSGYKAVLLSAEDGCDNLCKQNVDNAALINCGLCVDELMENAFETTKKIGKKDLAKLLIAEGFRPEEQDED